MKKVIISVVLYTLLLALLALPHLSNSRNESGKKVESTTEKVTKPSAKDNAMSGSIFQANIQPERNTNPQYRVMKDQNPSLYELEYHDTAGPLFNSGVPGPASTRMTRIREL